MKALTLEQINENNVVAKQYLSEANKFLKEIADKKLQRKLDAQTDSFGIKLLKGLSCTLNAEAILDESRMEMLVQDLKMRLDFYFKLHYRTCGLYSSYYSPDISIKQTSYGVIWTTSKTTTVKQVPHPANGV